MVITSKNIVRVFEAELKKLLARKERSDSIRRRNILFNELGAAIHEDTEFQILGEN